MNINDSLKLIIYVYAWLYVDIIVITSDLTNKLLRNRITNRITVWTCIVLVILLHSFYYVDASVWLENNQWHIFHILTSEDIDDVIPPLFALNLYNNTKKITRSLFSITRTLFSSLEGKIHIFAPPCNTLYIHSCALF